MKMENSFVYKLFLDGQGFRLKEDEKTAIRNLIDRNLLEIDPAKSTAFLARELWSNLDETEKKNITKKLCVYIADKNKSGRQFCVIRELSTREKMAKYAGDDNFELT